MPIRKKMSKEEVAKQLEPWTELKGKVVMVTGASSGIGKEITLDLANAAGCKIIAAARRLDLLKSLCDEINRFDPDSNLKSPSNTEPKVMAMELDITSDDAIVEEAVEKAWNVFGRIDVLINNAGIRGRVHTSLDLTDEELKSIIETNQRGSWLVSKYVCTKMCAAKRGGSVINISSISGLNRGSWPGGLAYASSKAGLNAITQLMAIELGEQNIRVNSICAGLFKSEITEDLMKKEWLKNVALRSVPLRDFGTVDPALTTLVRYLIHDSSNYVSGNLFVVDSGCILTGIPIYSSL